MFLVETMEIDFSALASRVAAFSDVLGCIIVSNDGLTLGWFPPGDEDGVKPAWMRFAALGEPDRAFLKFSSGEVWAYVSVGPYAAFAVATGATRPGILLDHLEQALLVAGESYYFQVAAIARLTPSVSIEAGGGRGAISGASTAKGRLMASNWFGRIEGSRPCSSITS